MLDADIVSKYHSCVAFAKKCGFRIWVGGGFFSLYRVGSENADDELIDRFDTCDELFGFIHGMQYKMGE